jgi:hypothetical protein
MFDFHETFTDQCTSGTCNVESVLYTGYGQSLTHANSDRTNISTFCKINNGGFPVIDNSQNYVLDTENKTFLCKDPRHPDQTMTSIDDPLTVTTSPKYNKSSKTFQKSDSTNFLQQCSDYCKIYNGNSNMTEPNFIIDSSNIFYCKSQFDPKILMPSIDTSKAKWKVDNSVEKANLLEVQSYCQTLRGGLNRIPSVEPYTFSTSEDNKSILFDCTSYWTGEPILSADIETAVYTDTTLYPTAQRSFETLEDVNAFCSPNKITRDTNTNRYLLQCENSNESEASSVNGESE